MQGLWTNLLRETDFLTSTKHRDFLPLSYPTAGRQAAFTESCFRSHPTSFSNHGVLKVSASEHCVSR